ncbi:hypothetical protein BGZ98_000507 [Dissophora globulifera]|nr:hypothetical protein BGZ98_000507 [Dissophora globulifera]
MEQGPISISIATPSASDVSLAALADAPFDLKIHSGTDTEDSTDLGYDSSTGSVPGSDDTIAHKSKAALTRTNLVTLSTSPSSITTTTTTTSTTAMSDTYTHAAASMASPPISPVSNINAAAAASQLSSLDTPEQENEAADAMMASLDAALLRKTATAPSATQDGATSDYYSSSAGGGSDNGQDDDPDMTLHAGTDGDVDAEQMQGHDAMAPGEDDVDVDKLSTGDLRMLLQHALDVVQEKDRDLGMAAMMGQDLLKTNNTLQAKYQHLLTQVRHQRMHRPRQLTPPRKIILSPAPDADGSVAVDDDGADENWVDFEPSHASSSLHPPQSPPVSSNHHHISFRRNSTHSGAMRSRSRHDMEKLASLEDLNTELQAKVDAITKELKQGRRQAFKRYRRAEQELKVVKDELERTSVKVVDLEEQNGRLIEASRMIRMRRITLKNQLPAPGSIPGSTMANMAVEMQGDEITIQEMLAEDNRIFEELRDRLQSLERKNVSLLQQKVDADKKASQYAQDLADTQKEHEDLLTNLCGFSDLQAAYDEQTAHVKELESSIQELQNTVSTMSSRLSQMNSPLMSPMEPSSPMWRRDDADFKALKTILHGTTPQPMALRSPNLKGQRQPRRTLLAELESEWFRDVSFFGPPRVPEQPPIHLHAPKSPKALKDHRHDSGSDTFSDDAGGRVKGWRERIRDLDEESVCESSSCIRKRRNQFKYAGSETHGEDSDVERYSLRRRNKSGDDNDEDDEMLSDGCCCHLYDDYSGYSSYDDEEESVVGWAHFEDYDASSFGYDKKRDGYYVGRRSRGGLFGMIQSTILLFRLLWRWCRFLAILSTALGMAIYRGPDALLTDGR